MLKNELINAAIMSMAGDFSADQLRLIRDKLTSVVVNYSVAEASWEIVPVDSIIPEAFKVYMVNQKINGMSERSLELYASVLKDFLLTINKKLEELTVNDIRLYLYNLQERRHISNRTLDGRRTIINTFLEWCANEEYIGKNPCRNIKPIRYQVKPREALTGMQIEMIRNACQTPRDRAMIEFFYSTGCRVSEAVGANINDLDLNRGELIVLGKGNKYRSVFLSSRAIFYLREYLGTRTDDNPALFVTGRSPHGRISKNGIERRIGELGELSGIGTKLFPHLLRHTTATDCVQRGMSIENVQKILGHSNINTTMIYAKTDYSQVRIDHKKCIV